MPVWPCHVLMQRQMPALQVRCQCPPECVPIDPKHDPRRISPVTRLYRLTKKFATSCACPRLFDVKLQKNSLL
jgi:hypothetical protein